MCLLSLCLAGSLTSFYVKADYALGCGDPAYHAYSADRFAYFDSNNRKLLIETLRDYERSVSNNAHVYRVISDLSRHLKYSAQIDDVDLVNKKINRLLDYADALSTDQHVAGYVLDSFSSETHAIGVARAWVAYRSGNKHKAFAELLTSIDVADSAMLSSFGPDFELVRQLYKDGHVEPVLEYLRKTEQFWKGKRADGLRYIWREMIKANCKVQFESLDANKALELGLSVIDLNKDYGVGW